MSSNHIDGIYLIRYWGGIDPGFEMPSTWVTGNGFEKTILGAPPATGPDLRAQLWKVESGKHGSIKIIKVTRTREAPHGFTLKDGHAKEGTEIIDGHGGDWQLEHVHEFGDAGEFAALIVPAGHEKYAVGRRPKSNFNDPFLLELQLKDGPGKPLLWRFVRVATN